MSFIVRPLDKLNQWCSVISMKKMLILKFSFNGWVYWICFIDIVILRLPKTHENWKIWKHTINIRLIYGVFVYLGLWKVKGDKASPPEAVSGAQHPLVVDEGPSTAVAPRIMQTDLPGPGAGRSILPPDDTGVQFGLTTH